MGLPVRAAHHVTLIETAGPRMIVNELFCVQAPGPGMEGGLTAKTNSRAFGTTRAALVSLPTGRETPGPQPSLRWLLDGPAREGSVPRDPD